MAAARQSISLMLNGVKNSPVSANHMRVLEIVGEDPVPNNSKQRVIDLSQELSTSSAGIYQETVVSNSCRKRPLDISQEPSTSSGIFKFGRSTSTSSRLSATTISSLDSTAAGPSAHPGMQAFERNDSATSSTISGRAEPRRSLAAAIGKYIHIHIHNTHINTNKIIILIINNNSTFRHRYRR